MALPSYFFDPMGRTPDGKLRWYDRFAYPISPRADSPKDGGGEKAILSPLEILDRNRRNEAYMKWIMKHDLRSKRMLWQLVRIHDSRKHIDRSSKDWWPQFEGAVFRVFMQPEYSYDGKGSYRGWYLLCPEDSEMVQRYRWSLKNPELPSRNVLDGEKYFSKNRYLRTALLVPIENCKHYRHETTAGALPAGL